jgi:hypothetical protein
MVHNLKFYRANRTDSVMDAEAFRDYVTSNALQTFRIQLDDDNSRDEDGELDHGDFIENALDYALGCEGVEGWEFDEETVSRSLFLISDTTDEDDRISDVMWPASSIS